MSAVSHNVWDTWLISHICSIYTCIYFIAEVVEFCFFTVDSQVIEKSGKCESFAADNQ